MFPSCPSCGYSLMRIRKDLADLQARIAELEEENKIIVYKLGIERGYQKELIADNQRLREALEKIAHGVTPYNAGCIARRALENVAAAE